MTAVVVRNIVGFLVQVAPAGFAEQSDGFMYYPPRLVVLALTNAVFFGAMAAIMRSVRRSLAARLADSTWWHMTALLLTIVGTLLLGAWLPPLDYAGIYFTLCFVIAIDCVALVGWLLRTIREASEQAEHQATLERALRHTDRARDELAGELARAHERVAELERRGAADPDETPVVLATPAQAVSFLPDEVSYVDSLNRVRAIHFADGESIQTNMTLAQIAEALPKGHFAYCHRSIVVNLRHVRSVGPTSLALNDGTELPVSRRRLAELWETLSGIQAE
ncbi:LytTR family DNA-binding domain-containing protein [Olsenella sp. An290]|uniref:LytTR family DNA-binding domain-containing protein n=1 Tax=Olsenella sp. An290 TaxID=1965625 RepID=UPI001302A344|nr:LytTR family DNA-binding domain-containing protein [Olsenella sp. An290]